jgi:hypothetical protein
MPPYGSIILFASTMQTPRGATKRSAPISTDQFKPIIALDQWNLKADSLDLKNTPLFNWRTIDQLKFSSAQGIYTSSFQWHDAGKNNRYYLDLGKVYFTAEVFVNGKFAGKRIFAPYMLDITPFLLPGQNTIEVRVTTGQLNGYIGKAKLGDAHYKQFKGKEDQLMAAGLIGPVVIRKGN